MDRPFTTGGRRLGDSLPPSSTLGKRPLSGSRSHVRNSSAKYNASSDPSLPRTGSIPLLWDSGGLAVHSTPVSLATRSLSSRSATSLSSAMPPSRHTTTPTIRLPSKRGRGKPTATPTPRHTSAQTDKTDTHETVTESNRQNRTNQNGSGVGGATPPSPSERGFNIAVHLHASRNGSVGSISPDTDRFLQTLERGLESLPTSPSPPPHHPHTGRRLESPPTSPSSPPHHPHTERGQAPANQRHSEHEGMHGTRPPKAGTRPPLAANFSRAGVPTGKGSHTTLPQHSIELALAVSSVEETAHGPGPGATPGTVLSKVPANGANSIPDPVPPTNSSVGLVPNPVHRNPSNTVASLDPSFAAQRIQRWYREIRLRQSVAIHRLLRSKRAELDRSRSEELSEAEARQRQEEERRHRRAAKMQAARRAAIADLQSKREEKRRAVRQIAQEEIALLQASGKIKKQKPPRKKTDKKTDVAVRAERGRGKEGKAPPSKAAATAAPGEGRDGEAANSEVIDSFFEAGGARKVATPTSSAVAPPTSSAVAGGKEGSTYTSILETLRLLEEAPPTLAEDGVGYLSAENLSKLHGPNPPTSAPLPSGKLHNIMTYLDQMERSDNNFLKELSHVRDSLKTAGMPSSLATPVPSSLATPAASGDAVPGQPGSASVDDRGGGGGERAPQEEPELQAATAVATDVTSTILAQRIELQDKHRTVEMLEGALSRQRELMERHAHALEGEGRRRLQLQRKELEEIIQRHQGFIDQLIEDKRVLGERCEQLVKQLRELGRQSGTRITAMEEGHAAEVARLKQVSATADRLRRERWKAEETQRIKEATVKSLEPEIQRIIARGKSEIQSLKALHQTELLRADERAGQRFSVQVEEVRGSCAAEQEQACTHERELARQRYEKLAREEEVAYQQERRRLFAEVQAERDKMAAQSRREREEMERERGQAEASQTAAMAAIRGEHSRAVEEVERRHASELRAVEERMSIEKQAWEENYMRKREADMMTKERELRDALRLERDREIEMVIGRLESETSVSHEETEWAAEARIKRVRDKYESEMREVERSERTTREKFNSMKTQVVELEGEVARLRSLLRRKETEVEEVGELASKLSRERDNVADIVRQEFADRLVSTEEENKQLKMDVSEIKARHRVELERMEKVKQRELEAVHERVKAALGKKEEHVSELRRQHEAAVKRAGHLEMLLERQRKELVRK